MAVTISPTTLAKGAKTEFFRQYHKPGPEGWQVMQMETSSDGPSEQYPWLGALPQVREWVTERTVYSLSSTEFTVENKPWESTISIHKHSLEDDTSRNGSWQIRVGQMAQVVRTFRWSYGLQFLVNGKAATVQYGQSYDGQPFYSHNHASGSNIIDNTASGNFNTTGIHTNNISANNIRDIYNAAIDAILRMGDGRGGYYDEGDPGSVLIILPSLHTKKWRDALVATQIANDSVTPFENVMIVGTPRLSSATATGNQMQAHILRVDREIKPLGWQNRKELMFGSNVEGDTYWRRAHYEVGIEFRGRGFYAAHQYAINVTLAPVP